MLQEYDERWQKIEAELLTYEVDDTDGRTSTTEIDKADGRYR